MESNARERLIQEIHAAGVRMVIAVTGGGSGAIAALLGVGGASRSVLAAAVPYAEKALAEWLGGVPDEFCAQPTARAMAMAAYEKARQYDPAGTTCGVACTASLASDRPKRGSHRAHLACQTARETATLSLELAKGHRSRGEEEALLTGLLLNFIAEACGIDNRLELPLLAAERPQSARVVAPQEQQDLLAGRAQAVPLGAARMGESPRAVFPGAFHPLHRGHLQMAEVARSMLGHEVAFELSVINVDKPPLDFMEIAERAGQFTARQPLWMTRAPRFVEKARLFPGCTFVVGADTIARVGQARYYGGQESTMETAIGELASLGCRFLVFGRAFDGRFQTLSKLAIPASLAVLCQEVPAGVFRDDVSSTELRRQAQ